MLKSSINHKGQITIPASIRQQLNFQPADTVEFQLEGNTIKLIKRKKDIKAAFGLVKVKKKVKLKDIEKSIQKRSVDDSN